MNIIVTGGSRGIGKAIVLKFATEGFNVAFCSRSEEKLHQLANEVDDLGLKTEMYFEPCDMGKKKEVLQFAQNASKRLGHFDVVVNNAGVFLPGDILNAEEGLMEDMIHTNLLSAYYFSRALLPGMIKHRSGHIFNICSVASLIAYPNGSLYSITKFGLLGFSRSLREELKEKNIRVTSVMPGATYTDSWEGIELPENRFMKAEDIASSVYNAFSMSDRTVVEEIILRPQLGDI